jgi:hypothetical protein
MMADDAGGKAAVGIYKRDDDIFRFASEKPKSLPCTHTLSAARVITYEQSMDEMPFI